MHSNLEAQENPQIKVWDIGVRIFHWSLVLFYTIAYISEDIELIHVMQDSTISYVARKSPSLISNLYLQRIRSIISGTIQ
jgi:hypothetical protein